MNIAIGIDVGYSGSRRSTGIVVIDRETRTIALGSKPIVADAATALRFVFSEVQRLKPERVTFCIDGPFAPAVEMQTVRRVERFFMRGPFASSPGSGPKLRLMPASTAVGSKFLTNTLATVNALVAAGHLAMTVGGNALSGNVVEIFP